MSLLPIAIGGGALLGGAAGFAGGISGRGRETTTRRRVRTEAFQFGAQAEREARGIVTSPEFTAAQQFLLGFFPEQAAAAFAAPGTPSGVLLSESLPAAGPEIGARATRLADDVKRILRGEEPEAIKAELSGGVFGREAQERFHRSRFFVPGGPEIDLKQEVFRRIAERPGMAAIVQRTLETEGFSLGQLDEDPEFQQAVQQFGFSPSVRQTAGQIAGPKTGPLPGETLGGQRDVGPTPVAAGAPPEQVSPVSPILENLRRSIRQAQVQRGTLSGRAAEFGEALPVAALETQFQLQAVPQLLGIAPAEQQFREQLAASLIQRGPHALTAGMNVAPSPFATGLAGALSGGSLGLGLGLLGGMFGGQTAPGPTAAEVFQQQQVTHGLPDRFDPTGLMGRPFGFGSFLNR